MLLVAYALPTLGEIQKYVEARLAHFFAEAIERPVHYQDVIATLYHNLGIDGRKTTVIDPTGRPQYLVDTGQPIRELI